jgi:homoaconitate hydratase
MGSREAFVYLSSPAVVAASAIAGRIASPQSLEDKEPQASACANATAAGEALQRGASCRVNTREPEATAVVRILPGFPERIAGELLLVPQDNLNTDGIYGKDYTYKESMTPEQMATVAMENYDPDFQKIAQEGDILVGGYNFGSGSSREQAVTALKYRGIAMIIAGSFSQTYKRNAFNNGYICIECPALVDELKSAHVNDSGLTIRTGRSAVVDFAASRIRCDGNEHTFSALGEIAQELVIKGGFEAVIREQLK